MPIGRLQVTIEILPHLLAVLPSGMKIIGAFHCVGQGKIDLAIEAPWIPHAANLTCLVRDAGPCRTIEIKERADAV